MDTYLLEFVRTNMVSLGLIVAVLYKVAQRHKWQWLTDILDVLKSKLGGRNVQDRPNNPTA